MKQNVCLCTALRQAALTATADYDRALAPSGLKVTMYRLLKNLCELDHPSITHLAKRVGLDRSTLGRNIKVLERDGLVKLIESDDEREKLIILTRKGNTALERARPLWRKAQKQMTRKLGAEKKTELLDILQQLKH